MKYYGEVRVNYSYSNFRRDGSGEKIHTTFRNIPTAMESTTGIVSKSGNDLKVGETRSEGAQRECLEAKSMMGLQGGREVVVKSVEILFGIPKEVGTATGFSEP
ncbi:hypothetical protein B0H11DRAFT_1904265 [Mycena galericulata]|nr:hypothetical protein B0H11DRAFT_1904265 [Mycena galericulata]